MLQWWRLLFGARLCPGHLPGKPILRRDRSGLLRWPGLQFRPRLHQRDLPSGRRFLRWERADLLQRQLVQLRSHLHRRNLPDRRNLRDDLLRVVRLSEPLLHLRRRIPLQLPGVHERLLRHQHLLLPAQPCRQRGNLHVRLQLRVGSLRVRSPQHLPVASSQEIVPALPGGPRTAPAR